MWVFTGPDVVARLCHVATPWAHFWGQLIPERCSFGKGALAPLITPAVAQRVQVESHTLEIHIYNLPRVLIISLRHPFLREEETMQQDCRDGKYGARAAFIRRFYRLNVFTV